MYPYPSRYLALPLPKAQVLPATGYNYKMASSFERYLGIDEQELLHAFEKTARTVAAKPAGAQQVA